MKCQYKFLCEYLPRKASIKNPLNPVLYIYDGEIILGVYAYDSIKKVLYVSDYNKLNYYYMSIYQFDYEGWEIIDMEHHKMLIKSYEQHNELPF